MKFDDASRCEQVLWEMRMADQPRGSDRAVLNNLFNGNPPFDEATAEENNVQINRNFLEGPNTLAKARRQFDTALLQPGNFFTIGLDSGPIHKRRDWASSITRNFNRPLKESSEYLETIQSTTASIVLHGIAPSTWESKSAPIPCSLGIESLLIPSETLRSFANLDHFAVFRQYTPSQLYDLTHGPRVDPGWNMPLVEAQLKHAATEFRKGANAGAYQYQPERIAELIKQDKGFWGSDAIPTIDCWDFYFRECEDGTGWYRRIVLDWGVAVSGSGDTMPSSKSGGKFLYTSKKRKYAANLANIMQCQFGDASAVAPFRYHSVRSLGWMIWGICDLQNRLKCRFTESVFEQLMWFFRTSNQQQFERLKKATFTHMGVIPDGIAFVGATERFKPDAALIEMAFHGNQQLLAENSSDFTRDTDQGIQKEMTATETIARANSANAMATGMLVPIYSRQKFQGQEIARRMCLPSSNHPISKKFRLACLKEGVPAEFLNVDRWNVDVERAMGGGNKTLEVAQATSLLELMPNLNPDAQNEVIHINIEAKTGDAALAERLVPLASQRPVSDATHDAQLAVGTLMLGLPVSIKRGINHIDYVEALLVAMATVMQRIESRTGPGGEQGGMATEEELVGLQNMAGHVKEHIGIIAQSEAEKDRVKQYGDDLAKMENMIRAYGQRLAEEKQKAAEQQGGLDPETQAKLQGITLLNEAKAQNMRESHGARTAQKQVQWEADQKRKQADHEQQLQHTAQAAAIDLHKKEAETIMDIEGATHKHRLTLKDEKPAPTAA